MTRGEIRLSGVVFFFSSIRLDCSRVPIPLAIDHQTSAPPLFPRIFSRVRLQVEPRYQQCYHSPHAVVLSKTFVES